MAGRQQAGTVLFIQLFTLSIQPPGQLGQAPCSNAGNSPASLITKASEQKRVHEMTLQVYSVSDWEHP